MAPHLRRPKTCIEVIALAQPSRNGSWLWYGALASGLFYFFGLFFGHNLWRVLAGS
jgi:hypothetical protein